MPTLLFEECAACRAKPGSPTLCAGCLRRRALTILPTEPFERAVFVAAYAHLFRGDHDAAVRSSHAAVSYLRITGDIPRAAAFAEPLFALYYDRR